MMMERLFVMRLGYNVLRNGVLKLLATPSFSDLRVGVGLKRVTISKEKRQWSLGADISLGWVLS